MVATYCDQGLITLLKDRNSEISEIIKPLRLYTAISPALSKSSLLANFTQVGSVMGYTEKNVVPGDWSYVLNSASHFVTGSASYVWVFTPGAGLTILGYYLVNQDANQVELAEQFASPIVIPAGGGTLTLTINDKYQQC